MKTNQLAEAAANRGYVGAFVGGVVPDEDQYFTTGFSRAGNTAQLNLLKSLTRAGVSFSAIYSFLPIPSYPASKRLFVRGDRVALFTGTHAVLLSFLNVLPFKQIHLGISVFFSLLIWSWRERRRPRLILLYNLTRPPALFAFLAARLTGTKIAAVLFDIGIPPLDIGHMFWYRVDDALAKLIVPRLDGRVVITERISQDYAPNSHYLHVDGAVPVENIPDWPARSSAVPQTEFVLAYGGSLWEINGIRLLLEAFSLLKEPIYRLEIAGDGILRNEVVDASKRDKRIIYHGTLSHDQVVERYRRADVLLNIRLTSQMATPYLFPSKLIEYFSMGRTIITTGIAHVEKEYGEYGFVLREETPKGLARLIETVQTLDADMRIKMAIQGREYVRAYKTWEYQGQRIADYLTGLFNDRARRGKDGAHATGLGPAAQ